MFSVFALATENVAEKSNGRESEKQTNKQTNKQKQLEKWQLRQWQSRKKGSSYCMLTCSCDQWDGVDRRLEEVEEESKESLSVEYLYHHWTTLTVCVCVRVCVCVGGGGGGRKKKVDQSTICELTAGLAPQIPKKMDCLLKGINNLLLSNLLWKWASLLSTCTRDTCLPLVLPHWLYLSTPWLLELCHTLQTKRPHSTGDQRYNGTLTSFNMTESGVITSSFTICSHSSPLWATLKFLCKIRYAALLTGVCLAFCCFQFCLVVLVPKRAWERGKEPWES